MSKQLILCGIAQYLHDHGIGVSVENWTNGNRTQSAWLINASYEGFRRRTSMSIALNDGIISTAEHKIDLNDPDSLDKLVNVVKYGVCRI